jgi:drug/metabolite transporter (DMT)-like permease
MLFYRPFMGNYLFGLLVNLVWLVPYRLHVEAPRAGRWWWAPLLLVLGVAAGMCNEHTGPAFLALGIAAVVIGRRVKPWMIAGLVGLAAGYVLLLIAPGHESRYGGLAKQAGLIGRVLERSIGENLEIVTVLAVYMLWSVPWIVLAIVARRRTKPETMSARARYVLWALVAAGVLATFVLLGSPKIGKRLYVHSVALVAMGLTGAVVAQLAAPWAKKAAAALAIAALIYVEARCLLTYARVGPIGAERVALIAGGAPGARVVVPRFPIGAGTWFLGDDLPGTWANTAAMWGLARIDLAPK